MFKVIIEKPEPTSVKLSRKNQVHITITEGGDNADDADVNDKLI